MKKKRKKTKGTKETLIMHTQKILQIFIFYFKRELSPKLILYFYIYP